MRRVRRAEETSEAVIAGFPVTLTRKAIKNMHLYVKPPDGHIVLTAPFSMPVRVMQDFLQKNRAWIEKKVALVAAQQQELVSEFRTGDTVKLWGRSYRLELCQREMAGYRRDDEAGRLILYLPEMGDAAYRGRVFREVCRAELVREAAVLMPKWEEITGLHAAEWQTKIMKTRWGTCNVLKKRVWLNVLLAEKPVRCLEYIILHELTHLVEKYHNRRFYDFVARFMPDYREAETALDGRRRRHAGA